MCAFIKILYFLKGLVQLTLIIFMMLFAALLHASWHALIKDQCDRLIGLAGMNVISVIAVLCFLPFVSTPSAMAWPYLLASVPFHIAYKLGLVRIYNYGDLGQTFPISRGSAPILATAIAFALTYETPTLSEIFAILLICFGIFLVASDRANQPLSGKAFWCGILTGLMVASYSVLNGLGARSNGDWLSFVVWLLLLEGGLFVALVWYVRKNTLFAKFEKNARNIVVSGLLGTGSFMIFLWALSEGTIGSVTALRETSIIFVTIIGGIFMNEKLSFFRIFAVSIVALGVILLALFQ